MAFPKQSFVDAAALEIVAGLAANSWISQDAPLPSPSDMAATAYDLAEALWKEREKRNAAHSPTIVEE